MRTTKPKARHAVFFAIQKFLPFVKFNSLSISYENIVKESDILYIFYSQKIILQKKIGNYIKQLPIILNL